MILISIFAFNTFTLEQTHCNRTYGSESFASSSEAGVLTLIKYASQKPNVGYSDFPKAPFSGYHLNSSLLAIDSIHGVLSSFQNSLESYFNSGVYFSLSGWVSNLPPTCILNYSYLLSLPACSGFLFSVWMGGQQGGKQVLASLYSNGMFKLIEEMV